MAIDWVDQALEEERLMPGPRALLLLRACQLAQVLAPQVLRAYWPRLVVDQKQLPAAERETFAALREAIEPPEFGGFVGSIIELAAKAERVADPAERGRLLVECERRLRGRWWWPFGLRPAWGALVRVWAGHNRLEGLKKLRHLTQAGQTNLVRRLNDARPLEAAEWDAAHKAMGWFGSVVPVVLDLLDRDRPTLRLSEGLAVQVAKQLADAANSTANDVGQAANVAWRRLVSLVGGTTRADPGLAQKVLQAAFDRIADPSRGGERWVERFAILGQLIEVWAGTEGVHKSLLAYLKKSAPEYARDFCLAHAYGVLCKTREQADAAAEQLKTQAVDKANAEAWFLVTLIRHGQAVAASKLCQASPNARDLLPRLRRAFVCDQPEEAAKKLTPEHFKDDMVGQFLVRPTARDRGAFLRQLTARGSGPLPPELWSGLDIDLVVNPESAGGKRQLEGTYTYGVPLAEQFGNYLRLAGYGYYQREDVDPRLLAALVAWDDEHPGEVGPLLGRMWEVLKLKRTVITEENLSGADAQSLDAKIPMIRHGQAIRNVAFGRCQWVFTAHPETFVAAYTDWVKEHLAGKEVYTVVEGGLGKSTMFSSGPLIHCLLGAQNVASLSAKRCDELITRALKRYPAEASLVEQAARLYASDKGLAALEPVTDLKDKTLQAAWQVGVVEASVPRLARALGI
jgi:hypothetical protein